MYKSQLPRRSVCRLCNVLNRPQSLIPLLRKLTHPPGCFVEGVRANDEVVFSTLTPARHEPYPVEYGQMLGHCLTADRKVFCEGRSCCLTAYGKQLQQIATRRIGERR